MTIKESIEGLRPISLAVKENNKLKVINIKMIQIKAKLKKKQS